MAYGYVNISGGKDIERIQNLSITYRCGCATPNERRFVENITVYIDFPTRLSHPQARQAPRHSTTNP